VLSLIAGHKIDHPSSSLYLTFLDAQAHHFTAI